MKYYVCVYDFDDNVICSKYVKASDEHKATSFVLRYCIDVLGYSPNLFGMILCDWSHKEWF